MDLCLLVKRQHDAVEHMDAHTVPLTYHPTPMNYTGWMPCTSLIPLWLNLPATLHLRILPPASSVWHMRYCDVVYCRVMICYDLCICLHLYATYAYICNHRRDFPRSANITAPSEASASRGAHRHCIPTTWRPRSRTAQVPALNSFGFSDFSDGEAYL